MAVEAKLANRDNDDILWVNLISMSRIVYSNSVVPGVSVVNNNRVSVVR